MMKQPMRLRTRMIKTSRAGFVACLAVLAGNAFLAGCDGRREAFIGPRVEDHCDESWPVCDLVAGCMLGPESYREGNFPGEGRFIVRIDEPSAVKVSIFLEDVHATGDESVLVFYEDACKGRVRESATGRSFVAEGESSEGFTREVQLNAPGDHLIEFSSDSQARYLIKVEVTSKRQQL